LRGDAAGVCFRAPARASPPPYDIRFPQPHPDMNVGNAVDKAHENMALSELVNAPVGALQGVSDADAEHLKAAFNIRTIGDLATNKFFLRAQAINALATTEKA
jgi:hypothetical protein